MKLNATDNGKSVALLPTMQTKLQLFVGILLLTAVPFLNGQEEEDADDSSSTTVVTTVGTQSSTGASATTLDSTATTTAQEPFTGSTTTGPSTTSGTPGTSGAPGSTVTGGAPASTTVFTGPTTTAGPTTLPSVNVNVAQFGLLKCDSTICTYQFDTPKNDQSFLATEDSLVNDERTNYTSLKAQADAIDGNIKAANKYALNKIQSIQSLIDKIQNELNTIQSNIKQIQAYQQDARTNMIMVDEFIGQVRNAKDNCLYLRCLKPTTPAPPTTTPTPAPTTPPSPCVNFTCPGDSPDGPLISDSCQLDALNKPFCNNCVGDLDGYNHCQTVTCNPKGSPVAWDSNGTTITWYSYGYTSVEGGNSSVPTNANCVYNFNGTGYEVDVSSPPGFNLSCLSDDLGIKLTSLSANGIKSSFKNGQTARSINAFMKTAQNPIFTFTSSVTSSPGYCYLKFKKVSSTINVEPASGFFGWLMGK